MPDIPIAVIGGLALPLIAAHLYADHAGQPAAWAAAKGGCDHAGRVACAKHVAVVTLIQALAVGVMLTLTDLDVDLASVVAGLGFTAWSHYWFDRRVTARGLYRAIGKLGFADLGTPRPGHDDNPSLGTGAYRMDQDWHHLWLAIVALVMAAPAGPTLSVLVAGAAGFMAIAIVASRRGRVLLAREETAPATR